MKHHIFKTKENKSVQTHTHTYIYIYIHMCVEPCIDFKLVGLGASETPRTNNLKSMHGATQICDFVHVSAM